MKTFIYLIFIIFFSTKALAINTSANEAIIIDFDTNDILYEKNSNIKTAPASMTKILTSYIVFDKIKNTALSINDECIISAKAYKKGGSRMFLEINSRVKINDLLKGIIIQSGNDSSLAIAECISGTEEEFAKLMNEYAKNIGMKNSNFINSSGWPDENHYSTVYDIAILSNRIIRDFPDLYFLFKEKNYKYNEINQPNRNQLLDNVLGVDGLKTGYTRKSGWGISVSSIREGRRITVVINNTNSSKERLVEAEKLINWSFRETFQKKLILKNEILKDVDVWLGTKPTVGLTSNRSIIKTLNYDQESKIKSRIIYEKPIEAPIQKDQVIGELIIEIENIPKIKIDLVANESVSKINPLLRVFSAIKFLILGNTSNE